MCLDSVKKPETFLKKLITEAGHVLKMCLFYAKSEPRCAYRLGAYKLKCVYYISGWQNQGHMGHIVPRTYSVKVGLIALEKEGKKKKKRKRKKEEKGKKRKKRNGEKEERRKEKRKKNTIFI